MGFQIEIGADTLEKVQEVTGAGNICGACPEKAQHLVEQFVKGEN